MGIFYIFALKVKQIISMEFFKRIELIGYYYVVLKKIYIRFVMDQSFSSIKR